MYRVGSPGTVTVSLFSSAGGDPDSSLASGTFDGDAVTDSTDGEWVTVILSAGVDITNSTVYAVVLNDASSSGGNYIAWRIDTANGYAGGLYKWTGDSGSTWNDAATDDLMFEILGVYSAPVDKTYSKRLVAMGYNELWYETSSGTMGELAAANGNIDTTKLLSAFEAYGKLFIANESNLKIADFTNTKIVTTDLNTHAPDFGTILTGGSSSASMIVDYITSTTADAACTIYGKRTTTATFTSGETVTGTDDDGNSITFVLSAAETAPPHWYDWTVYGNDTAFGVMPSKARWGCLYRGRAVLTDDPNNPHQWYMSRQFNPWDWLYVQADTQTPVAGNDADAGEVGDIVVSAIPYSDDYMIINGANTLYYIIGDPAIGGQIIELSLTDGIVAPNTWCWDGAKNLYILGTNGLLKIANGFGAPENLTEMRYPDFIRDLAFDPTLHRMTMSFDRDNKGLLITKTTLTSGANSNWWYDLRTEGLFPESYPNDCGVFAMTHYESTDPDYRKFIVAGADGYLREFSRTTKNDATVDSTQAIDSYFTVGPQDLSQDPHSDGIIHSVDIISSGGGVGGSEADSDDLTCKIFIARTAEEVNEKVAANSSPDISVTSTSPGRPRGNKILKPLRGKYAGLRIGNDTAGETWGLEKIILDVEESGDMI